MALTPSRLTMWMTGEWLDFQFDIQKPDVYQLWESPSNLLQKRARFQFPPTCFVAEVDAIFVDVPLVAGTVLVQGTQRFNTLSVKGMIYIYIYMST